MQQNQSTTASTHSPRYVTVDLTRPIVFQIPPGNFVAKLTFNISGTPFMKVAGTGTVYNVGPTYQSDTEYWYANTTSVVGVTQITMGLTNGSSNAQDLTTFFSGLSQAFTAAETVTQSSWTKGQYSAPSGTTARLFKAPDPDDATTYIGLVVAQDANNALKATAWYKTSKPSGGWVWQSGNMPISGLTWTLVTDSNLNPSLNPNDMQSGKTWYYIAQS